MSENESFVDQQMRERTRLKDQVTQLKLEKDAALTEARTPILDFLTTASKGAFVRSDLEKLDLAVLKKLKGLFTDAVKSGYDEILAERQAQRDAAHKPHGTIGAYNQETKTWENGE